MRGTPRMIEQRTRQSPTAVYFGGHVIIKTLVLLTMTYIAVIMSFMSTQKNSPKKETKAIRFSIRFSHKDKALINGIQNALADPIRGDVTETQAIIASLRIAADKLNVTPKS